MQTRETELATSEASDNESQSDAGSGSPISGTIIDWCGMFSIYLIDLTYTLLTVLWKDPATVKRDQLRLPDIELPDFKAMRDSHPILARFPKTAKKIFNIMFYHRVHLVECHGRYTDSHRLNCFRDLYEPNEHYALSFRCRCGYEVISTLQPQSIRDDQMDRMIEHLEMVLEEKWGVLKNPEATSNATGKRRRNA